MQQALIYALKACRKLQRMFWKPIDWSLTFLLLYSNGIRFSSFRTHGVPRVNVHLGGKCSIGPDLLMNNREAANPIGRFHRCSIVVGPKGNLVIGTAVGMSSAAIVCHESIEIGNLVAIGGGTVIYDTDFHSLNPQYRRNRQTDIKFTKNKPVKLGNNVFVGAHSTILKGVCIGDNSVIGACSVVTKNVPANEIWAGNPAKFIAKLDSNPA